MMMLSARSHRIDSIYRDEEERGENDGIVVGLIWGGREGKQHVSEERAKM